MIFAAILSAIITLTGIDSGSLSARAYFDCNNVALGDPMVLTLDFIGSAEFVDLHPPRLENAIDREVWKLDQASAKTGTFADGRRITYRVRPLKCGVQYFPALEFAYGEGGESRCSTSPMPVHVKSGAQVAMELAGSEDSVTPPPEAPESTLPPDDDYAWRKSYYQGDFRAALDALESCAWKYGQTPYVESAMIAVRARMLGNPYAELPAWRVIGRPILKYPIAKQLTIVASSLLAILCCLVLAGKTIRHFAAVSAIVVTMSNPDPQVGESFDFLFRIPRPDPGVERGITALVPSENYGLVQTGDFEQVSETLYRLPVRYDVPVKNLPLGWTIGVREEVRQTINRPGLSFTSSSVQMHEVRSGPIVVNVRPLENQPDDFSGIVAERVRFSMTPDMTSVESNDVITVTYQLALPRAKRGMIPGDWMPPGAAYWWRNLEYGREWRGYFVADGAAAIPDAVCCYYDPSTKTFKRATAKGAEIKYHE